MYINKRNRIYEINAILYKTFIFLIFNAFTIILSIFFRVVYCLHYLKLFHFVSKCFITFYDFPVQLIERQSVKNIG